MLRLAMAILAAAGICGAAARQVVIVDTDSCPFCDDGAALTIVLRSPEQVSVAAVTLVPGNTWPVEGAEYTGHILDLLHHPQLPLYRGAETALLHSAAMAKEWERRWGALEYTGAFSRNPAEVRARPGVRAWVHRLRPGRAAEFIAAEVERHPGAVTILAIGPMTNIALALRLRPEIETRIRRIVFMGGNLHTAGNASPAAEFNFWFDPEAARIVLRSRIPEKIMFGLDICNTMPIRKPQFDEIVAARTPITELFREDLGTRYPGFANHPAATTYLWDSLAAAYLVDPGFVTRSDLEYLDVLSAWGRFYGATVPLDRRIAPEATPVRVMQQLDYGRMWALFKQKMTE